MKAAQIVLIEDNPADVYLIELALKESGVTHEMTKFKSGEEALRALCPPEGTETSTFVPDAILLDLNTPKSDGFQVLIKLKQVPRLAHVPMAVITSSQAASDKHRTSLQGTRFIQKPAQLQEFLTTVGQAVKDMIEEGRASKSP
jgi:two-component system, chemotaxis family, response regulator Rcp1